METYKSLRQEGTVATVTKARFRLGRFHGETNEKILVFRMSFAFSGEALEDVQKGQEEIKKQILTH